MKKVILKKQYLHYPIDTELTFINESEADRLVREGTAKNIDSPPKDKMIRRANNKQNRKITSETGKVK